MSFPDFRTLEILDFFSLTKIKLILSAGHQDAVRDAILCSSPKQFLERFEMQSVQNQHKQVFL